LKPSAKIVILSAHAVAIGVGKFVQMRSSKKARSCQSTLPSLLVVFKAAARLPFIFPGGEFTLTKRELLLRRGETHVVVRDPDHVLADVQVRDFTTGRRSHVDVAGLVHGAGGRVRHVEVP
jgi:hypothetical protein